MDSLEQDLNTLRIYGRGLSRYDLQGEVDSLAEEDDVEEEYDDDSETTEPDERSSGLITEDLDTLDLHGVATRVIKLLKQELLYDRERNR